MGKTEYNHYIIFHQEKCHTFLSGKNCLIRTSHFITQYVLSAQAAITNYHRLKDLNNKNLFSHSYGAENLKPGYEHRPSPSEGSFLACQRPPSSCFLMGLYFTYITLFSWMLALCHSCWTWNFSLRIFLMSVTWMPQRWRFIADLLEKIYHSNFHLPKPLHFILII